MSELTIGSPAPDFSLPLDDGTKFTLAEHRGHPVVLFFYPQDDTLGCTNENKEFSQLLPAFNRLDARVLGISPDPIGMHVKFRAKHQLTTPLASDPEHLAISAYGLWQPKKLYGREFMGLVRTSFIIGADGRILEIMRATRIAGHAQKVLDALAQHLASGAK